MKLSWVIVRTPRKVSDYARNKFLRLSRMHFCTIHSTWHFICLAIAVVINRWHFQRLGNGAGGEVTEWDEMGWDETRGMGQNGMGRDATGQGGRRGNGRCGWDETGQNRWDETGWDGTRCDGAKRDKMEGEETGLDWKMGWDEMRWNGTGRNEWYVACSCDEKPSDLFVYALNGKIKIVCTYLVYQKALL